MSLFSALHSSIASWKIVSVVIFVRSPWQIIRSQFIGRGFCNKLINLSNEINCSTPVFILIITLFTHLESPACKGQGTGPPVELCGWYVDFETLRVIKLQLSLSASLSVYPSISAVFCQSPFETVSGRYSYGDVIHENTVFLANHAPHRPFFKTLKHSHSTEWVRGGSARSLICVCFVKIKRNAHEMLLRSGKNPWYCSINTVHANCYFPFLLEM